MNLKKVYLYLHSYELIIFLWLAIYIFKLPDIWTAIAIGMTQHLILDQITNPVNRMGYFISYRIKNRFEKEAILQAIKG